MPTTTFSPIAIHKGNAILRLAEKYPTLLEALLEGVQNALDSGARAVQIVINRKSRTVAIRDNGHGASVDKFEQALQRVAHSMKTHDKLGRFGIGLVSSIGKCVKLFFTSTPKADPRAFVEWMFECDKFVKDPDPRVPYTRRPDLWCGDGKSKNGISFVWWRTEVRIESYTKDRLVSNFSLASIREKVLERFNDALRHNNAMVEVIIMDETGAREKDNFGARAYEGVQLAETKVFNLKSGETIFRLFLSPRTGKKEGRVKVGETGNAFRLNFQTFVKSLAESEVPITEEVVTALTSGVFEGEIVNPKIRITSTRRGFEANETLVGFVASIEDWFENVGRQHFEDVQDVRQSERFQTLGARSLKVLEGMLNNPAGVLLLEMIQSLSRGTIGAGHFPDAGGKVQPFKSVATTGASRTGGSSDEGNERSRESQIPESTHPGHTPLVAVGPRGRHRKVVRSHSLGIQLLPDILDGDVLWKLELEQGLLRLNTKHPLWNECSEHGDKTLMRFQELLMLFALYSETVADAWKESFRGILNDLCPLIVFQLVHGDRLSGRAPFTRKLTEVSPKKEKKSLVIGKRKRA